MENDSFIDVSIDKPPYIKHINNNRVINVTGESGSGKTCLCRQYKNNPDFILIDTDEVFSSRDSENNEILQIRQLFANQSRDFLISNFDQFYTSLLQHYADDKRTLVIDSAQFRNIKDVSLLRGELIVLRTSADKCYAQCLKRYKSVNPDASEEEFAKYADRKKQIYVWRYALNEFIKKVDTQFR
jgi:adenylate kinase family enzyme